MRALALLVVLAVVGCGGCGVEAPSSPHVRIVVVDAFGFSEALPEYLEGARAWEPLGFDVELGARGEFRECPRRWYDVDDVDCQLTIELVRKPRLVENDGTLALSDIGRRGIAIDPRVADHVELLIAVAHETGHILLDTPRHTQGGIMGGAWWQLLPPYADLELACMTIGRCIDGGGL